jgi:glycoprotein-N-acetylgalactosamine 3-beta-galactosyltransferase
MMTVLSLACLLLTHIGHLRRHFDASKALSLHKRLKKARDEDCHPTKPSRHQVALETIDVWLGSSGKGSPRIFCAVYTQAKSVKLQRAQYDSWGKRCNDFKFFSDALATGNAAREELPTIVIAPEHGPESYDNMYHKVRAIWRYIAQRYLDEFDYFWLSGDDVFVIVENLRRYLATEGVAQAFDQDEALFLGRRLRQPAPSEWNQGSYPYDARFGGTVSAGSLV